jgi:hypothetical protein
MASESSKADMFAHSRLLCSIELDEERDSVNAILADFIIKEEANNPPPGCSEEEKQKRRDALAKRTARRAWEKHYLNGYRTPPGPWDHDLDNYIEKTDPIDFGDGYKGYIILDTTHMAWKGCIRPTNIFNVRWTYVP